MFASQPVMAVVALFFVMSAALAAATTTCTKIEDKLSSINSGECSQYRWQHGPQTLHGHDLQYLDIKPLPDNAQATRVLVIGGIHGDEFSSVTISFKWLHLLYAQLQRHFHWRIVPAANPDGLLANPGTRNNANGIDLNRNFPTQAWSQQSKRYWQRVGRDPRRFPGSIAASEIEIQWLIDQINSYNPDVIIAIHAPYHLLDFDGPPLTPNKLGQLSLRQLGIYPGSLGNYGSLCLGKQVVTLELASAGTMPPSQEVKTMWFDLIRWLYHNEQYQREQGRERAYQLDEACAPVN